MALKDRKLWIGTNNGLYIIDTETFEKVHYSPLNSEISSFSIDGVTFSAAGDANIAVYDLGGIKLDLEDETVDTLFIDETLMSSSKPQILQDKNGRIFLYYYGLEVYTLNDDNEMIQIQDYFSSYDTDVGESTLEGAFLDAENHLIIRDLYDELYRLEDDNTFTKIGELDLGIGWTKYSCVDSNTKSIWFLSEDNRLFQVDTNNVLTETPNIKGASLDENGKIWRYTQYENEVQYYQNNEWITLLQNESDISNFDAIYTPFQVENDSIVWRFENNKEVLSISNTGISAINVFDTSFTNSIRVYPLQDKEKNIWLYRYNSVDDRYYETVNCDGEYLQFPVEHFPSSNHDKVAIYNSNNIWYFRKPVANGSTYNVYRGTANNEELPFSFSFEYDNYFPLELHNFIFHKEDECWVYSKQYNQGLFKITSTSFNEYQTPEEVFSDNEIIEGSELDIYLDAWKAMNEYSGIDFFNLSYSIRISENTQTAYLDIHYIFEIKDGQVKKLEFTNNDYTIAGFNEEGNVILAKESVEADKVEYFKYKNDTLTNIVELPLQEPPFKTLVNCNNAIWNFDEFATTAYNPTFDQAISPPTPSDTTATNYANNTMQSKPQIYPTIFTSNSNILNISNLPFGSFIVKVINSLGQQVHNHKLTNNKNQQIELPNLKNGQYYVHLQNEEHSFTQKITIIR